LDDDVHTTSRKRKRIAADNEAGFKYISLAETDYDPGPESSKSAPSADLPQSNVERAEDLRTRLREIVQYLDSVKNGFRLEFDPQGSLSEMIAQSLDAQHPLEAVYGLITLFLQLTENAWDDHLAATLRELKRLCAGVYDIDLDARTVSQKEFTTAVAYVSDVKATLNSTSKPGYFRKFQDILKDFYAQSIALQEAAPRILELIESSGASHQDRKRLMGSFQTFLPDGYIINFVSKRLLTPEGKFLTWQGSIQGECK
jgi:hypothetical protein